MLTLPTIVKRKAQHYVAIKQDVKIPFQTIVSKTLPKVERWLAKRGIEHGPALFKYDVIVMPELSMQFGFVLDKAIEGDETLQAGVLPAGRYATVTWFGHYRKLYEVNGLLINWARGNNIAWDATESPKGDKFVSRFELYENSPKEEHDPERWETKLFIKVKD